MWVKVATKDLTSYKWYNRCKGRLDRSIQPGCQVISLLDFRSETGHGQVKQADVALKGNLC